MIKRILSRIKMIKNIRSFKLNAVVGEKIQFASSSMCTNTGSKENVQIGNHGCCFCLLQALCGGKIVIGDNHYIGAGTVIQSKESVTIGNNVIISNNVLIVDNNNHPTEPEQRLKMSECNDYLRDEMWNWSHSVSEPIIIEDNTWIGRDAVIMKGVRVGEGAIVGLRAVVTHDVPPYTVVAGNPARVVKELRARG